MSRANRAGILAAIAIALTAGATRADDEPVFTPSAAPVSGTPAAAPASSAVPWLAQPSPTASFTAPESNSSSRMMWLVLPALALGGAAAYMRLSKRRVGAPVSRRLEILDTARIGAKAQVVVVSVGGRRILLGVTDQSVQRLAWLGAEPKAEEAAVGKSPEKASAPTSEVPEREPPRLPDGPFAHLLKTFTHKVNAQGGSDAALRIAAETKDFVERRANRANRAPTAAPEMEREAPKAAIVVATAQSDIEEQVSGLRKRRTGKLG